MVRRAGAMPHARDDAPWSECGDRASPDFGALFAWPAWGGAWRLTYDRLGRDHALTRYASGFEDQVVLHGRRFDIAAGEAGATP